MRFILKFRQETKWSFREELLQVASEYGAVHVYVDDARDDEYNHGRIRVQEE